MDESSCEKHQICIIIDSLRAKSTQIFGHYKDTTDNLAELANKSTVYYQARSPSNWSLPSLTSMISGVPAHQHNIDEESRFTGSSFLNYMDDYNTVLLTGVDFIADEERGFNRCFDTVEHCDFTEKTFELIIRDIFDTNEPCFVMIHLPSINESSEFKKKIREQLEEYEDTGIRTNEQLWDIDAILNNYPDWWLQQIENTYDDFIRRRDKQVGGIIQLLDDLSILDKTRLIITSSHGIGFGEVSGIPNAPRCIGTGLTLGEVNVHVPLLVHNPGQTTSKDIYYPVQLTDFNELFTNDGIIPERPIVTSSTQIPPKYKIQYTNQFNPVNKVLHPWRNAYINSPEPGAEIIKYSRWNGFAVEQLVSSSASYHRGNPINSDVVDGLFEEKNSGIVSLNE